MKKGYITMACVALGISLLATGCKKEEVKDTFSLNAVIEEVKGTQKVHMEGLLPVWDNNDAIRVNNENCTVSITGTGSSRTNSIFKEEEEPTYCAVYPASYLTTANANITSAANISIKLPRCQDYIVSGGNQTVRMPMIAYSNTTDLPFKNLCSVLKVTVTNSTGHNFVLDSIIVTSEGGNLCGTGSVTLSGFTSNNTPAGLSLSGIDAGNVVTLCGANETSMNVNFNTTTETTKTFYIVVPVVSASDIFRIRLGIEEGFLVNKKTDANVTVPRNKLLGLAFTARDLEQPIDVILGPFTVDADDTRVSFSTGNLWYSRNDNGLSGDGKYHFETLQTDYTASINTDAEPHISHFHWKEAILPGYERSYNSNNTPLSNNQYLFTNKPGAITMANPSFTVEGVKGKFRCLSAAEWYYLLFERRTRNGLYTFAVVNLPVFHPHNGNNYTTIGLVILPDGSSVDPRTLTTPELIQQAGAAFLPIAGGRVDGTNYTYNDCWYHLALYNIRYFYSLAPYPNSWGYAVYWSSDGFVQGDPDKAYDLNFAFYPSPPYNLAQYPLGGVVNVGGQTNNSNGTRSTARAIRLVCKYVGN